MLKCLSLAALCTLTAGVRAAEPGVSNLVVLGATATEQVTQDWLTITLTVTREASDAATVQRQLKQLLEPALAEAKHAGQKLVKQTGVTVTPEVAIISGTRVLYRGRIDDRYIDFGKERSE